MFSRPWDRVGGLRALVLCSGPRAWYALTSPWQMQRVAKGETGGCVCIANWVGNVWRTLCRGLDISMTFIHSLWPWYKPLTDGVEKRIIKSRDLTASPAGTHCRLELSFSCLNYESLEAPLRLNDGGTCLLVIQSGRAWIKEPQGSCLRRIGAWAPAAPRGDTRRGPGEGGRGVLPPGDLFLVDFLRLVFWSWGNRILGFLSRMHLLLICIGTRRSLPVSPLDFVYDSLHPSSVSPLPLIITFSRMPHLVSSSFEFLYPFSSNSFVLVSSLFDFLYPSFIRVTTANGAKQARIDCGS